MASPPTTLANRGFISLLGVSFLGAANDNILKQLLTFMVATGLWANALGEGSQSVVFLCLTIPFIFLSGFAGQLADKYSKQGVIFWVKVAEVPIAAIAMLGLAFDNLWLSLGALLLLAIQSSFFGPAKFGVIPDIVDEHALSQANGLINMLSNIAVILGSLAAGPLSDMYYPTAAAADPAPAVAQTEPAADAPQDTAQTQDTVAPSDNENGSEPDAALQPLTTKPAREDRNVWIPGIALLAVALLGLVAACYFPKMEATSPDLRFNYNPFATYIQTFKELNRPLLTVMLSWSGFYLIGTLALLIIPEYKTILNIDYTANSLLVGCLGVSIAVGSVAAGLASGKTIKPYFIPFGAVGMTVCFALLGYLTPNYTQIACLIGLLGFFAGFYIIPLQALLQYLSPEDERGRFLGTANGLSFVFMSVGSLIFWVLTKLGGLPAGRVPLVCAGIGLLGTIVGIVQLNRIMAEQQKTQAEHQAEEEGELEDDKDTTLEDTDLEDPDEKQTP